MRKYLAVIAVAALTFGVVSFATADESVQTEVAKVKPKKLPKKGKRNIKLKNTITTFDKPGTNQPPKGERTILDLPKQIKVSPKKVKYCKTNAKGLESAATTEDAIKMCGKKSVVSKPRGSSAQVRVDLGSSALTIDIDVTAFNENHKKLLLYSKPTGSASGIPASILVGKLKNANRVPNRPRGATASGPYKKALDVKIPPLDAGAISFFQVTVKKGKYLRAKCKPRKMKFRATTFFSDADPTVDKYTFKCKPKRR